ncbi:sigmaK-factor processing regulatory BofA [Methanothermobacter thermautotrophicus]|uniref:SigmaK-factor processing regulatory BofA n=1 Tax=Methanothermobacter thermautotrophicus TaxID=145262 RepID=A0A842YLA9_METTF|nr:pro-sigmaK processing inhibitor BofA family protein [Methanothermobacter thermautotrophicus]MBE2900146.1 sigmaK-factor processing regulatory BofA [Methanothermobacter thermautotrophicus]
MEGLPFLILIVIATFIVAGGLASLRILMGLGKRILTVAGNMVAGIILLLAVNILPFINIPINLLTVLVAGFGGITGVGILLIGSIIGLV